MSAVCSEAGGFVSLFTDADFCYLGADLRRYTCRCPISTCVTTDDGSHCEYTTFTIVVSFMAVLIGLAVLFVYVHVSEELSELQMKEHASQEAHKFRDVLFGVYHASDENAPADALGARIEKKDASSKLTGTTVAGYGT